MPRKNPETKFKEAVLEDLKTLSDIWFSKIQQVAIRGTPDILLCVRGIFIAIELKTEKGRLSELQRYTLEKILKAGGYVYTPTPKTWKEHFQEIKEIANGSHRTNLQAPK